MEFTQQKNNPQMTAIYRGKTGQAELNAERKTVNPNANSLEDKYVEKANINDAYFDVTKAENIETLTNLHDAIMYWQTLFGHLPSSAAQKPNLDSLLGVISTRIQKLIVKDNKKKDKFGADFFNKGKPPAKSAKDNDPGSPNQFGMPEMPDSLKRVGVPNEYFVENFVHERTRTLIEDKVFYLDMLIRLLEGDKVKNKEQAGATFNDLEALGLKDFYLLKSVVYAHFGIVLDKIVGTDREAMIGQQLTKEEKQAIVIYSGGKYKQINAEARAAMTTKSAAAPLAPGVRPSSEASYQREMELTVSGLNKLPKYQGKLYRGLATPPAGFAAYAQEGAVTGDLGFSSATPAITAVYEFLKLQYNTPGNIIYVIQSKTGSNILSVTFNPQEGEILFRPGTRFQINKIWKHTPDGKIPEDAPADVQMILHKKGEFVDMKKPMPNGETRFQTQVIMITEV
ncbi:MAG: hypothetical protein ABI690_06790 [Chloroflexota bacterium]